jgi:hypothetical protein
MVAVADINDKVEQLDIDTAHFDNVIQIFGEPIEYRWGNQIVNKNDLPVENYCLYYPDGFWVWMRFDWIMELRFESAAVGYVWNGGIRVGSSLSSVLAVVGQPTETVIGQPCGWEDGVLYKDINGTTGYCYYRRADQNVRFFFLDYKVNALYVTRSDFDRFRPPEVITSVEPFDDVRWKDMRQIDLSDRPDLLATLWFNRDTIWPNPNHMPSGCDVNELMTNAMNPGLGIRGLHQQGITGEGINVAIIDQPMYLNHPEFAGKIVACYDTGCGSASSMHGPAVTGLLVGTNCGTASDANVYYAAVPSWLQDTAYYADALDWIIVQNKTLPPSEKIRVVSVSAAPSGPGSPFIHNTQLWDQAYALAEAAGILVLDCTNHHGFIGPCWYDANDPEDPAKCTPGFPGTPVSFSPEHILVPCSPRTTAEQYYSESFSYQYCGRGGLSWSIPYCAGVLAMGWQIQPEISGDRMRQLLFESAHVNDQGARIINPQGFIELVKQTASADFDKDGDVDFMDFCLFAEQWMHAE